MKIYIFITSMMLLLLQPISGQAKITLEYCHQKATDNYPLIRQYDLISKSEQYTLSNIGKIYLPQVSINGQASYQTSVTKLPIDLASLGLPVSIESLDKDQYKATIDVSQTVWDGGNVKVQRKIVKANSESEKYQLEVTLYQIKDKVNQLYFGLLALDEQLKLLDILEENLNTTKKMMLSMFQNGTITQSDLDQIEVELLNISQNRIEQESMRNAFLKMLSLYIHEDLSKNTILEKPQATDISINGINRPEIAYYNSLRLSFDAQHDAITAKNMPKIGLFVQGGYGRPGLNMLENKFSTYAIGGVKLSWNFGNLYTRKNETKQIEVNKSSIDTQEKTFLFNTNLQLTNERAETEKIKKQMEKDDEIISLRNRVKNASESKYKNGVYPISDLIRDINAENQAQQMKALREIQYLQSIHNYIHIQGVQ